MSNTFQVSTLIAKNTTEFFLQKDPLYASSNHDFQGEFMQTGYMTGGSINIKIPGYPTAQRGLSVTASAIQDLIVPYTITENDIFSVTRNLTSFETLFDIGGGDKALTTDQKKAVVDNYAWPAYTVLKADIESECATKLTNTAYYTPVDGIEKLSAVNNFNSISDVRRLANDLKLDTNRFMMMNTRDAQLVSNSLQNYFSQAYALPVLKSGSFAADKGRLAGFDVYESTELREFTAGTLGQSGAALTVTSINTAGNVITFSGAVHDTTTQIKAGDRISIPSVYLVDTVSHSQIPWRLVVTAADDAQGDGAGNISVTISYPLMASGEHQNVASLPANGASAVVFPNRYVNYAYTKAGLSTVPLTLPKIYGAMNDESRSNKFPVRVVVQGAALEFQNNYRVACMVGTNVFAPYVIEFPSSAS